MVQICSGKETYNFEMPSGTEAKDFQERLLKKLANLENFEVHNHNLNLDLIAWETKHLKKKWFE